jgi:tRNA pseudouridine55 synthase
MKSLLRTKVSVFELADSLKLADIDALMVNQTLDQFLMPVDACFMHLPRAVVLKEYEKLLYNGNLLKLSQLSLETLNDSDDYDEVRVYDSYNTFTGIYEYNLAEQYFRPVKMFLP